jgi:hypothetical protein
MPGNFYQFPDLPATGLWSRAMNDAAFQLNLVLAWAGLLLGFLSGMGLGMFFHDEKWLGGYASHRRRMYRLGHISFFGLGTVNLLFWLTARTLGSAGTGWSAASVAFVIGAITMPLCCAIMAHRPKAYLIFSLPVISLIAGGSLTLWHLLQS